MARWKGLPNSLDDRVLQLVVQLRRLKDRSGLSLASLESKSGYSRASWERYLNGRALPPRKAVEELARVSGVDPARLLVLHEMAEEGWRNDTAPADVADAADTRTSGRPRRKVVIGLCTGTVLAALIAGALLTAPWQDQDGRHSAAGSGPGTAGTSHGGFVYQPGRTYPCTIKREHGRLYAGYSTTRTAVLSQPGWDVVEAQCLLRHRGFDPGGVDGVYGPNTTHAVKLLQEKADLPVDGVVGWHTWKALRK
ncbi:peptidoglycan-binding protein [Streptomyces brasiliensis]|uniref:peptidoglycan-binding protein n=1 Tax=Streptomyces brasiliensis TaxID=1954 RepID=UPI001E556C13|nr:peptidoglycan-binding protein [Streptomyces brasiliensis]